MGCTLSLPSFAGCEYAGAQDVVVMGGGVRGEPQLEFSSFSCSLSAAAAASPLPPSYSSSFYSSQHSGGGGIPTKAFGGDSSSASASAASEYSTSLGSSVMTTMTLTSTSTSLPLHEPVSALSSFPVLVGDRCLGCWEENTGGDDTTTTSTTSTAESMMVVEYEPLGKRRPASCSSGSSRSSSSMVGNFSEDYVAQHGTSDQLYELNGPIVLSSGSGGECGDHRRECVDCHHDHDLHHRQRPTVVYRAKVKASGEAVAMKVMTISSEARLSEMKREMSRLYELVRKGKEIGGSGSGSSRSSKPYLVEVYAVYWRKTQVKVVMELMDGSLAQLLRLQIPFPEEVIAGILKLVLRGVDYLHRHLRLVHRGIKPSNILFNVLDGSVKLSDFGTSTTLDATNAQAASGLRDAMVYMSPERLEGEPYGFSSDIWSVGVVALELAQGFPPYELCQADLTSQTSSSTRGGEAGKTMTSWSAEVDVVWEENHRVYWKIMDSLRACGAPTLKLASEQSQAEKMISAFDRFVEQQQPRSIELKSFLSDCLRMDPKYRLDARDLLNHSWVELHTLSEECFDQERFQVWLSKLQRRQRGRRQRQQPRQR